MVKPLIDIKKSRADAPEFRHEIFQTEQTIFALEDSIKQLLKNMKSQMELSQEMNSKNSALIGIISEIARQESDEPAIETSLTNFANSLQNIEQYRLGMLKQLTEIVVNPLEMILRREMSEIREFKKNFEKVGDNLDSMLDKYLAKKAKDPTIQEAADEIAISRVEFHEKSVRYAKELNDFQFTKRPDLLQGVLGLMMTQFAFFHQAYNEWVSSEDSLNSLSKQLQQVRLDGEVCRERFKHEQREMFKSPISTYNPMSGEPNPATHVPAGSTIKSGYLMKKGSGKIGNVWSRRWFLVKGCYLLYSTRGKEEQPTVAANLRLCSVKAYHGDAVDRRFCFEVVSPVKSYLLQAESEREMKEWIEVLQNAIGKALNSDLNVDTIAKDLVAVKGKFKEGIVDDDVQYEDSPGGIITEQLTKLRSIPGNEVCADCKAENPEWASINLGVIVCIECSGIHRSLGVHISKVRSLTLDRLEQELYDIMAALGNTKVNSLYEAGYKADSSGIIRHATPKSDRAEREKWIQAKYIEKAFIVAPEVENKDVDFISSQMWKCVASDDLLGALKYLVLGARVNWKNPAQSGQTALMYSIDSQNHIMTLFLLNMMADISSQDNNGMTCLHYAVNRGNEKIVRVLLKRNAKADIVDKEGRTSIDLALKRADPELVTLLRMHHMDIKVGMSPSNLGSSRDIDKTLPQRPSTETSEISPTGNRLKISPVKVKNFFSSTTTSPISSQRPDSPNRLAKSATDFPSSNNPNANTASRSSSSAMAVASSMANSAGKYLGKIGFAKMHNDAAPSGANLNSDNNSAGHLSCPASPSDSDDDKPGSSGSGLGFMRSSYTALSAHPVHGETTSVPSPPLPSPPPNAS